MKIRKFVFVKCPQCGFSSGGYYLRDCTPSHPIDFECKRDRIYSEEDQQMYKADSCGAKWSIAVTEEAYEEWLFDAAKELVLGKLYEESQKD